MNYHTLSLLPLVLCSLIAVRAHAQSGAFYTPHDRNLRFGKIDLTTGAGTDIGSFGATEVEGPPSQHYRITSGAFDVNGDFYATALLPGNVGSQLSIVDVSTGLATPIGPRHDTPMNGIEIDANGTLFAMQYVHPGANIEGEPVLHHVDKTTGTPTPIGDTGVLRSMDMAFDSAGALWLVGGPEGGNRLYTLDPTTGASTFQTIISDAAGEIDVAAGGLEIMGISFDEHDTLYATAFLPGPEPNLYESPLFRIDTMTGFADVVGQTGFRLPHGGDYLVPEPSSLMMLFLGFLGLARRRPSDN